MRLPVTLAVLLTAALTFPAPARAAGAQLGVPPEDIVLLKWVGAPPIQQGPVRILMDGTNVPDYKIPPGHVLVITDLEWDMNALPAAGTTVDVFIQLTSPGNLTNEAYRARVAVDINGFGYLSDNLTSALVVDSSVDLDPTGPAPRLRVGSIATQGMAVTLRGYLLRAKPGGPPSGRPGRP
jgi:hypothetical protein